MIDKERMELINLRKRVQDQREEIKRLQSELDKLKAVEFLRSEMDRLGISVVQTEHINSHKEVT